MMDKVALITGSSRGLAVAFAHELALGGARYWRPTHDQTQRYCTKGGPKRWHLMASYCLP